MARRTMVLAALARAFRYHRMIYCFDGQSGCPERNVIARYCRVVGLLCNSAKVQHTLDTKFHATY